MPGRFLRRNDPTKVDELFSNQQKVLKFAQEKDHPIYVLEYHNYGETINKLKETLGDGSYQTIIKSHDNGFLETSLGNKLENDSVKEIVLMGVNASYCVKSTATDALRRGYAIATSPELISDPKGISLKTLGFYKKKGKLFSETDQLIDYLTP